MVLLGGRAGRRPKILGFLGPLKCDSLRGKRSKRGPKSGKIRWILDPKKLKIIKPPSPKFWSKLKIIKPTSPNLADFDVKGGGFYY